ncbi:hypothetical protein [Aliarcobacter skirrowii]|uniref:Capsule biosynthesis protein CapA n=1 Tax=Aliarcobacter skirrowii TaxID=28200 RepID=A0AAW9DB14_9BACT|nr:hypothetical protein [Aliarcobacter skirrowii]MDX4069415.1 hypothetical protein [Aliarcobacter skirrowii]
MRICLTYDFISTKEEKGLINQSKKIEIIGKILEKLGLDIDYDLNNFSRKKLLEFSNLIESNSYYEEITFNDLTNKSLEYLRNSLKKYDYLITYELSENSKIILENLGIKFIDIWLSPIRFYKDILFEFYSNEKDIYKRIQTFNFDDKKLFKRVKKLKIHSKLFLDEITLEENSCLIIGQMLQDKSIMKDGRFLTLLDFMDHLKNISEQYSNLYLLKHPYLKDEDFDYISKELIRNIKNIKLIKGINTYQLLMKKEIKHIIGISSSVLVEAKYFKKEIEFLYKPIISEKYVRVYKDLFSSNFWKKILDIKKEIEFKYLVDDNFFRLRYNLIYSYDIFMKNELNRKEDHKSFIKLYNFIINLEKERRYILYGYGTIGKLIYPFIKDKLDGIIDINIEDEYINEDYRKIRVLKIEDLKDKDYVIISPINHNENIKNKLIKYTKNIVEINLN